MKIVFGYNEDRECFTYKSPDGLPIDLFLEKGDVANVQIDGHEFDRNDDCLSELYVMVGIMLEPQYLSITEIIRRCEGVAEAILEEIADEKKAIEENEKDMMSQSRYL